MSGNADLAGLTTGGHKATPEVDRFRVVCTECPWFKWLPGATLDQLREAGRRHRDATRIR